MIAANGRLRLNIGMNMRTNAVSQKAFILLSIVAFGTYVGGAVGQPLRGTLVVAVPIREGLVVCSDKRLYNNDAGSYIDNYVKIRKAGNDSLFVATNTIGFYDRQTRTMAFDAFEITTKYVASHDLNTGKPFWDGLKKEITAKLRAYLAKRSFDEWPESDRANNNLLFNLIFYSVSDNRASAIR